IDVAWPLRRLPPWRWLLRARHRPALACTHAGAIEAVTEQGEYDGRAQSGGKKSSAHCSSPRPDPAEVAVAASAVAASAVLGVGLRKASCAHRRAALASSCSAFRRASISARCASSRSLKLALPPSYAARAATERSAASGMMELR